MFSTEMKATCKKFSLVGARNKNNQNSHLSPFITSLFNFHILPLKSVIPNFGVFGIPRNGIFFIKLISPSDTLTKHKAAILKICPPAIITSAEVIIAEYVAILGQWERENLYNHLSNYTNSIYIYHTSE